MEMQVPMVVALNMMDEVRAGGGSIDLDILSEGIGVPVVPISAAKNEGITELVEVTLEAALSKKVPAVRDLCEKGPVHRCIHSLSHMVEDHADRVGISSRFATMKLIEGDMQFVERLGLSQNEIESAEHLVWEMESEGGLDIRKPLFSLLVRNNWPLIGAEAANVNLEDVFLALINNSSGADAPKKKRISKKSKN
jgi:ferrous iron transport protein B